MNILALKTQTPMPAVALAQTPKRKPQSGLRRLV
jgi:hypothetical protein